MTRKERTALRALHSAHARWRNSEAALHHAIIFALERGIAPATIENLVGIKPSDKAA